MFETLIGPQGRNSLTAHSHASSDDPTHDHMHLDNDYSAFGGMMVPITPELRTIIHQHLLSPQLIIPKEAKSVTHTYHLQMAYSIWKRHEGNSGVLFNGNDTPFSIERMLQFPADSNKQVLQGTWVIVRRHQYTAVSHDPYVEYPHLGMRMWDCALEPDLEAMPIECIHSHFAKCTIPWEGKNVAVVISLSWVC